MLHLHPPFGDKMVGVGVDCFLVGVACSRSQHMYVEHICMYVNIERMHAR